MTNQIAQILHSKVIAIVGLSKDPTKDSHSVAKYLQDHGYKIIPINPTATEILGEKVYPDLLKIPEETARQIEIVDVFRPSAETSEITEQAISLHKKFGCLQTVWLQLGIENDEAKKMCEQNGIQFVQNKCIKIEHERLHKK